MCFFSSIKVCELKSRDCVIHLAIPVVLSTMSEKEFNKYYAEVNWFFLLLKRASYLGISSFLIQDWKVGLGSEMPCFRVSSRIVCPPLK